MKRITFILVCAVFAARVGGAATGPGGGAAYAREKDRPSFGPLSPSAAPCEREYIWPKGKTPCVQVHQIAAKTGETKAKGFRPENFRDAYIEWYAPRAADRTDTCVIFVSGGGFNSCCDAERMQPVIDRFVRAGVTVANLTYRTPRPNGLPIHQTAWIDAQRAVRVVRSQAAKRGFSPDRIGATGISAGAKAVLLIALSSRTRAYDPVDAVDDLPCGLAFAIAQAPAYVLDDGATGANARKGVDASIVPELVFDEATAPLCLLQGGTDIYTPLGSVRLYQRLHAKGMPAELHLFADRWHGFHGDANRGANGTAWDHWCDRMLEFAGRFDPKIHPERFVWRLPEVSAERVAELERRAVAYAPVFVVGNENATAQTAALASWEVFWLKGVQCDLHLIPGPVTVTERASRLQEFLNHRQDRALR